MICIPKQITPPKTNMEPKNGGLVQMIFLFKGVIFQFHVSFRGSKTFDHFSPLPKRLKKLEFEVEHRVRP